MTMLHRFTSFTKFCIQLNNQYTLFIWTSEFWVEAGCS